MSLREIRGNEAILQRMKEAALTQQVSHAYILEGAQREDRLQVAREFIKAVLCLCRGADGSSCDSCPSCLKIDHGNHEDVWYVEPEGTSIKDEAIEEMQRRLANRPYGGSRNVVILQQAATMTLRAQNRLLKTLEEPAPGTVILLLTENAQNLAQTVRSRCILYRLQAQELPLSEETCRMAASVGELWLQCAPFYRLAKAMEPALGDRQSAASFLDSLELWLRDVMVSRYDSRGALLNPIDNRNESVTAWRWPQSEKQLKAIAEGCGQKKIDQAVAAAEEARRNLERNINTGYTLKGMLLRL